MTAPMDPDTFGARLAAARVARQITQAELAELLTPALVEAGVRSSSDVPLAAWTIGTWERDRHRPPVDVLRVLCELLQVSADGLLGLAPFSIPSLSPTRRRRR